MNKFWFEPRTIVAYAVSLLALAEIVDLTIVGVAVPHIMGSLSANLTEVSTTITSYIVAAAVCIPLTGLFVRKFGMKNVVLVSTLLFGISSVLCGIATSVTEMIIFRIIQGIGGAFLPSIAQSYISQNFTQEEQPKIMTVYSLCVVMGPIIGPIFGGVLAEQLTWRWCFYVNVPLCAAGFALVYFFMPKQKTDNVKIDVTSFLFMALGIGFLEYFIDEGNTNNWFDSFSMIVIFLIAIILIGFFIWRSILG
ncbi:MAG: MFS transporter, partial [Neisseriaceae bacterium]